MSIHVSLPVTISTTMAENVPQSASKPVGDRGQPYYEKLKRDLRDTINKKRLLDKNMALIEESIFKQESAYLEETSLAGNIVKGFDSYIKAAANTSNPHAGTISGAAAGGTRRKAVVNESDRIFSKSSVNWNREGDSSGPGSGVSTPAATPTASVAGDKKKKKDDEDVRSTKRLKVAFTRKGNDD